MAKELPYFKFEPNEWQNGNIQMCSSAEKALFIDLCCLYWSRLGDVPLKLAVQKVCGGNATAINSLCDEGILTINDGQVSIKFLDDQLLEFSDLSSKNSNNAKIGWEKRRSAKALSQSNATALVSQSQSDAIREEKRREDKIKEDINKDSIVAKAPTPSSPKKKTFKQWTDEEFKHELGNFRDTYSNSILLEFYNYWSEPTASGKLRLTTNKSWDTGRRLKTWAGRSFNKETVQPKSKYNARR